MKDLRDFFKNKRILVTGHTGFKGSWLVQTFLNWDAKVSGIALKPATTPNLFDLLNIEKKINNYFTDIRNFEKVKEIVFKEKPEIVFHLAAQPLVRDSYDDPLYTFETNIIGTANILQAIKEFGKVKSAVMITTDKVYQEKEENCYYMENDKLGGYDPYSSSKVGAEVIINSYIKSFLNPKDYKKSHETLLASARAGNVIGGGDWQKDRILPDIVKAVFEKKEKLIIRNPQSIRPWQYILEPLYGYMLLAKRLYQGEKEFSGAWNFGPKEKNCLTVRELVEKSLKFFQKEEAEFCSVERDYNKHEANFLKLDISKAEKLLGWSPAIDIDKSLELTLNWYNDFYNNKNITKIADKQIKLFFEEI